MQWSCVSGFGFDGKNEYASAAEAGAHALALNREGREGFGMRPLLSMLPLKPIERAARRTR
jgi:hypothetical protein